MRDAFCTVLPSSKPINHTNIYSKKQTPSPIEGTYGQMGYASKSNQQLASTEVTLGEFLRADKKADLLRTRKSRGGGNTKREGTVYTGDGQQGRKKHP